MKRLLTSKEAAAYCAMGKTSFRSNCPVQPKRIAPGERGLRYDVRDLDKWIDGLASTEAPRTADDWLGLLDAENRQAQNSRRESVSQQGQVIRLPQKDRTPV